MPRDRFDAQRFYVALDVERKNRSLTWKKVANQAHVSASSLTRMAQGKRPDVDTMAALASWGRLRVDEFIEQHEPPTSGSSLAEVTAYLRADPQLSPEAAEAIENLLRVVVDELRDSR